MATTKITNASALVLLDALVDRLDNGTTNTEGRFRLYGGTEPTYADDAASATVVATCNLSNPAFGAAADQAPHAQATASAISSDTSAAGGTCNHFRGLDRDLASVIQGDAGTGSESLVLNSAVISAGAQVDINSWTVTLPES